MKWFSILAVLSVILGAVGGVYFRGRHDVQQADKVAVAQNKATVATLNTQGVQQSEQRVRVTVDTQQAASALATQFRASALAAGDAHAPLDPDRAARLHASDVQLCGLDTSLGGCPAH